MTTKACCQCGGSVVATSDEGLRLCLGCRLPLTPAAIVAWSREHDAGVNTCHPLAHKINGRNVIQGEQS